MPKKIISETSDGRIIVGTPNALVQHKGSYTAALGRIFQSSCDGMVMILKNPDGSEEKFYLEEVP